MDEIKVLGLSGAFLIASIIATILTVFVSFNWFWTIFLFAFIGTMLAFYLLVGYELVIVLALLGIGAELTGMSTQPFHHFGNTLLMVGLFLLMIGWIYYGFVLGQLYGQMQMIAKKEKRDKETVKM